MASKPVTRRQALLSVGVVLGNTQDVRLPMGVLTVDLNQYKAIRVRFGKDDYFLDPAEVFQAFKDEA